MEIIIKDSDKHLLGEVYYKNKYIGYIDIDIINGNYYETLKLDEKSDYIRKCSEYEKRELISLFEYTDSYKDLRKNKPFFLKEEEINFNKIKNKKFKISLYTGETGSGKTYNALKTAYSENKKFLIAVPTRQLAYEIFIDYKDKFNIDTILTGEFSKIGKHNAVVVYENLEDESLLDKYDTLLIDEIHFLADENRGGLLLKNIIKAIEHDKEIITMTATDTLPSQLKKILNIKTINLKSPKKIKREHISSIGEAKKIIKEENLKTIVFTKYMPDESTLEEYASLLDIPIERTAIISADIPTSERVLIQYKYKKGELDLVVSSNVLAQGVNFPTDLVIIEYNEYDTPEIIEQKIGRAGRPSFNKDKAYYLTHYKPPLYERKTIPKPNKSLSNIYIRPNKEKVILSSIGLKPIETFKLPNWNIFRQGFIFKAIKYSKSFLEDLSKILGYEKLLPEEKKALNYLRNEDKKVIDTINYIENVLLNKNKIDKNIEKDKSSKPKYFFDISINAKETNEENVMIKKRKR